MANIWSCLVVISAKYSRKVLRSDVERNSLQGTDSLIGVGLRVSWLEQLSGASLAEAFQNCDNLRLRGSKQLALTPTHVQQIWKW